MEARLGAIGLEEGHRLVGDLLRRWGVTLAQVEPAQREPLASLIESARASLLGQLSSRRPGDAPQGAPRASQAGLRDAERERRLEAGRAEVRRLQEETAQIQEQTWRMGQQAADRRHQLARAALFPEQHCPYCSRAYLDLTGGCWHCQSLHRPGHF